MKAVLGRNEDPTRDGDRIGAMRSKVQMRVEDGRFVAGTHRRAQLEHILGVLREPAGCPRARAVGKVFPAEQSGTLRQTCHVAIPIDEAT